VWLMASKILLPFDGSKCSVRAAKYVADMMSGDAGIHCLVLFVLPFTRDLARFLGVSGDDYDLNLAKLAGRIKWQVNNIFNLRGLKVPIIILEGDPLKVICEVAKREECKEIVIGSRGHTGIKKIMLGSLAGKISKKASCPVRIIK